LPVTCHYFIKISERRDGWMDGWMMMTDDDPINTLLFCILAGSWAPHGGIPHGLLLLGSRWF
jgi:hypothetical protein